MEGYAASGIETGTCSSLYHSCGKQMLNTLLPTACSSAWGTERKKNSKPKLSRGQMKIPNNQIQVKNISMCELPARDTVL